MYLDVDVLYALLKDRDYHKEYAQKVVSEKEVKVTSSVSLLELEIVVKRELGDAHSLNLTRWVERLVPGLKIIAFSHNQFEKSLELRAKHGLGIFDAVHAAVCLERGGRMASTDKAYARIPGIRIVT